MRRVLFGEYVIMLRKTSGLMRVNLLVMCALSVLCGCQYNTDYVIEWQEEKTFMLDEINTEVLTSYEILPLSRELLHAKDFWVYQDTVLIVLNKPTSDYWVEFYSTKSGAMLTRKIRKGNGPMEMLNCNARVNTDSLYVRDFVKGNYTVIDLKEIIQYKDAYELEPFKKYKEELNVYDVHEIGGKMLFLNPYCFSSSEDGVDNKEPRFFYSDGRNPDTRKLNAFNVSQGHILINESKRLVLFAGLDLSQIEIYDYSLAPLTKITGPKKLNVRYSYNDGRVSFFEAVFYSYMGACNAGDSFYVTYSGQNVEKISGTYIFQFDWSGNLLGSFFLDKYLATISTSSDGNTLYVRGKDDDGLVVLYKFYR